MAGETYEGLPCKKVGHTRRYVVGRGCVECMRQDKKRRLSQPDKYAKVLEQNRLWKKENLDKIIPGIRQRKARIKGAVGSFTNADIALIREEQGNRCPGCLLAFSETVKATIDHFVPIEKGGTNAPSNIQLLCLSCNCSKRHSDWESWQQARKAA